MSLTLIHIKQQSFEQWGQRRASRSFSMQMKHLKTSARLCNTNSSFCQSTSSSASTANSKWLHRKDIVMKPLVKLHNTTHLNLLSLISSDSRAKQDDDLDGFFFPYFYILGTYQSFKKS